MKQAAIIARVSTANQSFDRQLEDLKALAKGMGYSISDDNIYAEKVSGVKKEAERIELHRLLNDVQSGKNISMVFCSEISRISRIPKVGRDFVETLESFKIPVYIQNMQRSSLKPDGSRDGMFHITLQILLEFAASEAEFTKVRMASGKLFNFKEGRNVGGNLVLYGYDIDKKVDERKAGKLVINKEEAKIIRKVFDMYIKGGAGIKVIANHLNDEQIPTRTGVPWSITTVNQMLKQTAYYGTRFYKGEYYEGIVPDIISKETFELASKASTERNVNPERNTKYLYLLQHRCGCGYCGANYVPKFSTGRRKIKNNHYQCGTRYANKKFKTCKACGIGIDKLESIAWHIIKTEGGIGNFVMANSRDLANNDNDIKSLELKLNSYQSEISKKNDEKRKWQKLFAMDRIGEAEVNVELDKLDMTLDNLKYKVASTKKELELKKDWIIKYNKAHSFKKILKDIGTDRVKINEVIQTFLEKTIITSVNTGSLSDWFIISVFTSGILTEGDSFLPVGDGVLGSEPLKTVLYNKRTLEYYDNPDAEKLIKYDITGIHQFDVKKVVKVFKQPYIGLIKKGKNYVDYEMEPGPIKVEHIPFTRLNILDEFKVVA